MSGGTLELQGVSAGYGRVPVLHAVDLQVPAGAALAILGANGAGKTTTLRTISGLLRPTSGRITVDGQRIDGMQPWDVVAAGVGHVPEGRGVFPSLTVTKNLQLVRFARRDAADGLSEEMRHLFPRLAERAGQQAGTMSGGEQQMLAVARVLEMRPRVLLLDELSLGLAPLLVKELFAVIREIRAAGTTIVMVEQFVGDALALADYVAILAKGTVAWFGETAELRSDASNALLSSYLGAAAG